MCAEVARAEVRRAQAFSGTDGHLHRLRFSQAVKWEKILTPLYRRTGRRDRAEEHLTTATAMCREIDMRFSLEPSEAEMKRSGWDSPARSDR